MIGLEDSAGAAVAYAVAYTVGIPNAAFVESAVPLAIDWGCASQQSQVEENGVAGSRVDLVPLISRSAAGWH